MRPVRSTVSALIYVWRTLPPRHRGGPAAASYHLSLATIARRWASASRRSLGTLAPPPPPPTLSRDALGEEHLQERLVGNVPLIRQHLELVEHPLWETQRDRGRRWLEVWKDRTPGFRPIEVFGRIGRGPEFTLRIFSAEGWNGLR